MSFLRSLNGYPRLFLGLRLILAAVAAILLAGALKLDFAISAGIVAILSVASTRRETLRTALARLLAFICALVLAFCCFSLLGYTTQAFLLYLACFLPLCLRQGWNGAMAMDSVLISHFLSFGRMDSASLLNEAGIFAIGVGLGILVNLLILPDDLRLQQMKKQTDEQIRTTLRRMAQRITDSQMPDYDGTCIDRLYQVADSADEAARIHMMNRLGPADLSHLRYLAMRRRQIDMLREMYHQISTLTMTPETAGPVADFLLRVSDEYAMDNTAEELLRGLEQLQAYMKAQPLPDFRSSFESRASLFSFMQSLRLFLMIKRSYSAGEQKSKTT